MHDILFILTRDRGKGTNIGLSILSFGIESLKIVISKKIK